jgi:hypothetical protein
VYFAHNITDISITSFVFILTHSPHDSPGGVLVTSASWTVHMLPYGFAQNVLRPRRTRSTCRSSCPVRRSRCLYLETQYRRRHDRDGHPGSGRCFGVERHRHKTQIELEAQIRPLLMRLSPLRASPTLLNFLVLSSFASSLVTPPIPIRIIPSAHPTTT